MLRKLNLIFTIAATILLGFAVADSTQAQTPCANCESASLLGDTVNTQFASGPVVSRVVTSAIELPNAGPTLGGPGGAPRWNIDFTSNMIRINFLQPVTSYSAGSVFKFSDLNPQIPGCEAFIGSVTVTTSKSPTVFNVSAATTFTPDSVTVPIAGSVPVTWVPGEFILIQLSYRCKPTCCDRMTATPVPNPPLQQTYKTFDFYNLKSPASNICSVDIAFSPLPHTGSWQGGGLYIDSGSGLAPIPAGTKFIWNYTRVPNNPPGSVIAAVPSSSLTIPSLRFNLGFDNTQPYTGTVTFKVNHCDGTFCTLTNQWIFNPNTGGTPLPFRQSIRDLNAEFSELTLTYNAESEIQLAKGVKGAKWLGLNLLGEDAEIYSVDGAEVPNEKASGENKRLTLHSSSKSPKAALFEFSELLNPNSREQNDKTITIIIKKNIDKKVEPKIVLSLFDENANLIASDGQN